MTFLNATYHSISESQRNTQSSFTSIIALYHITDYRHMPTSEQWMKNYFRYVLDKKV